MIKIPKAIMILPTNRATQAAKPEQQPSKPATKKKEDKLHRQMIPLVIFATLVLIFNFQSTLSLHKKYFGLNSQATEIRILKTNFLSVPNAKSASVAIVSLHDEWPEHDWVDCTLRQPKITYANMHGYAYLDENQYMEEYALPPNSWMNTENEDDLLRYRKLRYLELILRARLPFKWILWMDGTSRFTNFKMTVEERLAKVKEHVRLKSLRPNPTMVLSHNDNGDISTGVWLIRNTRVARFRILKMYNQEVMDDHGKPADVASITQYMFHNLHARKFFTTQVLIMPAEYQYEWESFPHHNANKNLPSNAINEAGAAAVQANDEEEQLDINSSVHSPWILNLPLVTMRDRKIILFKRRWLCGNKRWSDLYVY